MTLYTYKARVERVVDGDTWVGVIDLGMFVYHTKTCRMLGYNAPELFPGHAKTKDEIELAKVAKLNLERLIMSNGGEVTIETHLDRDDKYGRILAQVTVPGVDVNAEMLELVNAMWADLRKFHPDIYKA